MSVMRGILSKRASTVASATAISLIALGVPGLGAWSPNAAYGVGVSPRTLAQTCDVRVSNDTDLRAAVANSVDDSVICISQSITLTGQLNFNNMRVTLVGDDSSITLTAAANHRHISSSGGSDDTLTIRDLTLTGGSPNGSGGSILTDFVDVVTEGSTFTGNATAALAGSANGGAISARAVFTTDTNFTNNSATNDGGAIRASSGVTTNGGTFSGNTATVDGGAIRSDGTVTTTDTNFANNTATTKYGGAIRSNSTITTNGGTFTDDSAGLQGGALFASGAVSTTNTSFTNNTATGEYGGAIRSDNSTVVTNGGTFHGNVAGLQGGAIHAKFAVTTTNTDFSNNTATGQLGGAIRSDAAVTTNGGTFTNNTAGQYGGAVRSDTAVTTNGGTFTNNTAGLEGGALFAVLAVSTTGSNFANNTATTNYGGAIRSNSTITTNGGTFTNNRADKEGGAVLANGAVSTTNTNFSGNTATTIHGGAIRSNSTITTNGGTFTGNTAGNEGGAVHADLAISVINSTFTSNSANSDGGAVFGRATVDLSFVTSVDDSSAGAVVRAVAGPPSGNLTIVGTVISPASGNACSMTAGDSSYDSFATDTSCGSGDDTVTVTTRPALGLDDTLVTDDSTGAMVLIPDDTSVLINAAPDDLVLGVTTDQLGATRGRAPDDSTTVGAVQVLPILFTSQPADASVSAGGTATFTVAAQPGVGTSPARFQWQTSSNGGATWTNAAGPGISGATTGTLTMSPVSAAQNGLLIRAVSSDLRPNAATSGTATLTVASNPAPPSPLNPGAPRNPEAVAGDRSAEVTWEPPASTGDFPITSYEVVSDVGDKACLAPAASVAELSCEIAGLTNGTAYRFRVRALNGAGWGPWSDWSAPVTPEAPPIAKTIVITGSRDGRLVSVRGTSAGLTDGQVIPRIRVQGQDRFRTGKPRSLDAEGTFTWKRTTIKRITVFFVADGIRSNRVVIPPRR